MSATPTSDDAASPSFRMRGLETTRLDTFVDAAFALGTTVLLVAKGQLPTNYEEFVLLLLDAPAFFLSFGVMMIFWLSHRSWSRHYGLENNITIALSLLLVFCLLIYVYPLKLMFGALVNVSTGGAIPTVMEVGRVTEVTSLIAIYAVGFTTLSATILLLYIESLRRREELALTPLEVYETRSGVYIWLVMVVVGVIAAVLAKALPPRAAVFSGFAYWLLAVLIPAVSVVRQRRSEKLFGVSVPVSADAPA